MQTEVLRITGDESLAGAIAHAAAVLRRGGLVAFPTETVYGLGANALDPAAVQRIFAAKGRPATNPLIVHVAHSEDAGMVAAEFPERARRLAERLWPGPLTLVLPKRRRVPDVVTAGLASVAVRVPAHRVARALLEAAGLPIAAPSANRSSALSPTHPEHVLRGLDGRIDLLIDAGPTTAGLESTVLDVTSTPPRLLRPGTITPAEIEAVVGPILRRAGGPADASVPLPSPGMLSRHYAPRAPLECSVGAGRPRVLEWLGRGARVGWLTFDEPDSSLPGLVVRIMPRDPAGYAAELYAALHALDDAGVDRIVVDLPPETEPWLAIHDRLRRAAAPE